MLAAEMPTQPQCQNAIDVAMVVGAVLVDKVVSREIVDRATFMAFEW
jgi:hypothetical protein